MSNIAFYVRVTNLSTFQCLGLVGVSDDFSEFKSRILSVFPQDEYSLDDMHQLAPMEVRVVHPDCKGQISKESNSLFVSTINKLLI